VGGTYEELTLAGRLPPGLRHGSVGVKTPSESSRTAAVGALMSATVRLHTAARMQTNKVDWPMSVGLFEVGNKNGLAASSFANVHELRPYRPCCIQKHGWLLTMHLQM
jgi:hypothetical protein